MCSRIRLYWTLGSPCIFDVIRPSVVPPLEGWRVSEMSHANETAAAQPPTIQCIETGIATIVDNGGEQ